MPFINAASLVVTGVLTTGSLFGVATVTGPDADLKIPCGAVWQELPADLRADLLDLKALPPGQRPPAAREIRRDALAGEYGARVQRFAEHRSERVKRIIKRMPADLRQDVRAARQLPPAERVEALKVIREGALAGEYGARVQQVAEQLKERRATCRPDQTA